MGVSSRPPHVAPQIHPETPPHLLEKLPPHLRFGGLYPEGSSGSSGASQPSHDQYAPNNPPHTRQSIPESPLIPELSPLHEGFFDDSPGTSKSGHN